MPRNRRSEVPRDERVAEIVTVAQRQLREGGFRALSIKALASELGLAQAAVYWYFPTKDHLFVASVESVFMAAWARKPHSATLTRQVQWFADELADLYPFIVSLRERAQDSPAAADFVNLVEGQIRSILAEALQRETIAPAPADTAEILLALVEGLAARGVAQRRRRRLVAATLGALVPSAR